MNAIFFYKLLLCIMYSIVLYVRIYLLHTQKKIQEDHHDRIVDRIVMIIEFQYLTVRVLT